MRKTVSAYDAWTCPTKLQKTFQRLLPYRTKEPMIPYPRPLLETRKTPSRIDLSTYLSFTQLWINSYVTLTSQHLFTHPPKLPWSCEPVSLSFLERGPHNCDYAPSTLADPPKSMIDAYKSPYPSVRLVGYLEALTWKRLALGCGATFPHFFLSQLFLQRTKNGRMEEWKK